MQEKEQQLAQKGDTIKSAMNIMDDASRSEYAAFSEGVFYAAMRLAHPKSDTQTKNGGM